LDEAEAVFLIDGKGGAIGAAVSWIGIDAGVKGGEYFEVFLVRELDGVERRAELGGAEGDEERVDPLAEALLSAKSLLGVF